jgi:hypothetical protein
MPKADEKLAFKIWRFVGTYNHVGLIRSHVEIAIEPWLIKQSAEVVNKDVGA